MNDLARAVTLVRAGRRFLVTAHRNPDGDALGSMLATAHALRALGKDVVAYDRDPAPARLAFLPGARDLVTDAVALGAPFDATFVHDSGDARLLGDAFPPPALTGPLVVLDHHASARPFGDLDLRDPSAAATGVLVARFVAALGVGLTREIAECLWCALVSDTGWFRYSATNAETLRLGAACVEAGASPWAFAEASEERWPVGRLRLLGRVLDTLELWGTPPRQAAVLTLTEAALASSGADVALADGFVNYARGLDGVEVGVLASESGDGIRVSLRSKGSVDVGALAARLGGGGHRAAAGCTLPRPLASALGTLRPLLMAALAGAG